jgi:hypothetical protein
MYVYRRRAGVNMRSKIWTCFAQCKHSARQRTQLFVDKLRSQVGRGSNGQRGLEDARRRAAADSPLPTDTSTLLAPPATVPAYFVLLPPD